MRNKTDRKSNGVSRLLIFTSCQVYTIVVDLSLCKKVAERGVLGNNENCILSHRKFKYSSVPWHTTKDHSL